MKIRTFTLLLLSTFFVSVACSTSSKIHSSQSKAAFSTVKDADSKGKVAGKEGQTYLKAREIPNAMVYLPEPPADGSPQFLADSLIYLQTMQLRDTPRGRMALEDNDHSPAYFLKIFSEPMGIRMSQESTPEIYGLVAVFAKTVRLGATAPKREYMRKRPFVRFGGSTITPDEDEYLARTGSYPSGHSLRGWAIALLLAEINPAAQDAILKRGYEYGQSRVIGGYHYQSDVDAARMVAAAAYARLHSDEDFLNDLKEAKEEFEKIKATAAE